jgi:polyhydroxybutyrate depolymerase
MKRAIIPILALLLAAAACGGDAADGEATTSTVTRPEGGPAADREPIEPDPGSITAGVMLVDDAVRQYLVAVPPDYSEETPAPVIFDLHGRGGTAPGQALTSAMTDVAWGSGFIVVHPQGLGDVPTWSVWPELPELANDLAFFEMMIDVLDDALAIDRDRVFVTGFSNGGGMAGRLACEMSDQIAGIAVVGASNEGWQSCEPSRPVPVFALHGTGDQIVPFDGGQGLLPSMPEWAAWWASSNGCEIEPETGGLPGGRFWRWDQCEAGATVSLIALEGLGHEWPLQVQRASGGDSVEWLGATHLIVAFFASL